MVKERTISVGEEVLGRVRTELFANLDGVSIEDPSSIDPTRRFELIGQLGGHIALCEAVGRRIIIVPTRGQVKKILVEVGDEIEKGGEVILYHAMDMDIPIRADRDGVIADIFVAEGEDLDGGQVVAELSGLR